DVLCVRLGADGRPLGEPRSLARDVRAWQAQTTAEGAALATVHTATAKATTGTVELLMLDSKGAARGKPILVSAQSTANFDLDLARVGGGLVVTWSDMREGEPHLFVAAVDGAGRLVRGATRAVRPMGEQSLVRLVAPFDDRSPAFLAWENLAERYGA